MSYLCQSGSWRGSETPTDTPPVLLIAFNRPETTEQVIRRIRDKRPAQFFVACDGPRNSDDAEAIKEVKLLVDNLVDWPCELHLNFNQENLGCRKGVVRAIDWFFSIVPEGIILEDDTVPNSDFFDFCGLMLDRYRENDTVMHISGDNTARVNLREAWSYCFIRYPHIWGWATWKSAWDLYDRDLSFFAEHLEGERLEAVFKNRAEQDLWVPRFIELLHEGKPDTWDWQWAATVYLRGGLSIQPTKNLVSNIGFGPNATHTTKPSARSNQPTENIFPIEHPPLPPQRHRRAERQVFNRTQKDRFSKKVERKLRRAKKLIRKKIRRIFRGIRERFFR